MRFRSIIYRGFSLKKELIFVLSDERIIVMRAEREKEIYVFLKVSVVFDCNWKIIIYIFRIVLNKDIFKGVVLIIFIMMILYFRIK